MDETFLSMKVFLEKILQSVKQRKASNNFNFVNLAKPSILFQSHENEKMLKSTSFMHCQDWKIVLNSDKINVVYNISLT